MLTEATGGTGFIGVQLAKALGAKRVVSSTSGAANIALAKAWGADEVIDYKVQDIFVRAKNVSPLGSVLLAVEILC